MLLWSTLLVGAVHAGTPPLAVGVVAGPVQWVGSVPSEYAPRRTGAGYGAELSVPAGEKWTVGGGVTGALWSVGVPESLEDPSDRTEMRFDALTLRADVGRTWSPSDRFHVRVRGGPAAVAMVLAGKAGATVEDCGDGACPPATYDTEDDRVVVEEALDEGPRSWRPGAFVSTGVQWQAIDGEQGLVVSADVFSVITGTHERSGMGGASVGLWLGMSLGG